MKIVVVGAGIAGLAIGWRLAQAGAAVEIFDRGLAGRGATWAAAGMIAPGVELKDESDDLTQFARRSRAMWPGFAAQLEAESGCAISYNEPGSFVLARDEAHRLALQQRADEVAASGEAEWLTPAQARKQEPLLSAELRGALHIKRDAQVDNRLVGQALLVALQRRNVTVRENTEVRGVLIAEDKVRGVLCSGGGVQGDAVILASGAWMNDFGGMAPETLPRITPVKGQMVAMQPSDGTTLPQHLLWGDDVYLVTRGDRVLVGATVEDVGFDMSVSRDACDRLVSAAARIIPALAGWRVAEMWAGFRPRTPDGAPALGASALAGLYVAGGQFRNGILFAPAIADAMRDIVMSGQTSSGIQAFDPRRFNSR